MDILVASACLEGREVRFPVVSSDSSSLFSEAVKQRAVALDFFGALPPCVPEEVGQIASSLMLPSAAVCIFFGILTFSAPFPYRNVRGEDRFLKWRDQGLPGHVLLPEEQVKTCGHLARKRLPRKPSCAVHLMQCEQKRWCIVRIRVRFVEKQWVIVSVRVMI